MPDVESLYKEDNESITGVSVSPAELSDTPCTTENTENTNIESEKESSDSETEFKYIPKVLKSLGQIQRLTRRLLFKCKHIKYGELIIFNTSLNTHTYNYCMY